MFEDYWLSTEKIAARSGASQETVRAYLRLAYYEPLESRLLWTTAWRKEARAARLKAYTYWRQKFLDAPTPAAQETVLARFDQHQRELELHV